MNLGTANLAKAIVSQSSQRRTSGVWGEGAFGAPTPPLMGGSDKLPEFIKSIFVGVPDQPSTPVKMDRRPSSIFLPLVHTGWLRVGP